MTALRPTSVIGWVAFVGLCPDRANGFATLPRDSLDLDYDGIRGDAHAGLTRPACVRVKRQYRRGTEIRNSRQITVVSIEELDVIARRLGTPGPVRPEHLGANIALSGAPHLSNAPSGARLIFSDEAVSAQEAAQAADGPALAVDLENAPCKGPADALEAAYPGCGRGFVKAAMGLRGLTAWVERPGTLSVGAVFRLHLPPPREDPPEWFAG